jgi:hypothetical protein
MLLQVLARQQVQLESLEFAGTIACHQGGAAAAGAWPSPARRAVIDSAGDIAGLQHLADDFCEPLPVPPAAAAAAAAAAAQPGGGIS